MKGKRISMYMLFIPTGDIILTENPENYFLISEQKFGLN